MSLFESINEPMPRQADPGRTLDHELRLRFVIRLRSEGKSSCQIADILHEPERTVRNWLAEASGLVKSENRQFINEMFAVHQHRCEELYAAVRLRLEQPERFTPELVKAALAILDRQSKLLGLDKGKAAGRNSNDWLEDMTTEELIEEAKKNNIPVPESFNTKVNYGSGSGDRG